MRYQSQEISTNRIESPVVVGDTMMLHTPITSSNISQQQQPQQHQQQQLQSTQGLHPGHTNAPQNNTNVHIHHQQIFAPSSQMVQGPMIPNLPQNSQMSVGNSNGSILMQGQHVPGHTSQQRIFINGQSSDPGNTGPGRPNIQMIPVSVSPNQQVVNQRMPLPFYSQQQYPGVVQQCDHNKASIRPQFMPSNNQCFNGYKQGCSPNIINSNNTNQIMVNQQQRPWPHKHVQQNPQNSVVHSQNPINQQNAYERVPPLHQHTPPPTVWSEDLNRKKIKVTKSIKKRPFTGLDNQHHRPIDSQAPCPNIDVRQIPTENNRNTLLNQYPQQKTTSSSPSFMEDPSGYLAQQTALLNNTISRQTGM